VRDDQGEGGAGEDYAAAGLPGLAQALEEEEGDQAGECAPGGVARAGVAGQGGRGGGVDAQGRGEGRGELDLVDPPVGLAEVGAERVGVAAQSVDVEAGVREFGEEVPLGGGGGDVRASVFGPEA
jgi:hypothetical protein